MKNENNISIYIFIWKIPYIFFFYWHQAYKNSVSTNQLRNCHLPKGFKDQLKSFNLNCFPFHPWVQKEEMMSWFASQLRNIISKSEATRIKNYHKFFTDLSNSTITDQKIQNKTGLNNKIKYTYVLLGKPKL